MVDRATAQLVVRPFWDSGSFLPPPAFENDLQLTPVSATGYPGYISTSAPPVGLTSVRGTGSTPGSLGFPGGGMPLALVEAAGIAGVASATPVFVMNAFASDTAVGHLGLVQLPGGTQLQLTQSLGIGATGKVAILTQTLVGIQAGTATGTIFTGRPPLALVQTNSVGTPGTPLEGVGLSQTGVSATGIIGNALPPSVRAMTQASATGNVGSLTFTRSIPSLTNDSGATALGTFTPAPILGDFVTSVGGVNNIVTVIASDQVVTVSHFVPGSGGYVLSCAALAAQTGGTNSPAMVQSRVNALSQNAAVGVNGGIATVGGGNNVLSGNQASGDVGSIQAPLIGNVAALTIVVGAGKTGLSFVMGIPGADVTTVSGSSVFTVGGTQVDTIGTGVVGTPLTMNRGTGKTGQVVASFPGQGTFALTGVGAGGDTGNVTPELPRSGADVVTISGKFVTTIAAVQVDTN